MAWRLREQARSHRVSRRSLTSGTPQSHCGSLPASDSGGSGNMDFEWPGAFASKPAPTGSGGVHSHRAHHKVTVGACLQAIAVDQATLILNGLAPSRAGSLPQDWGWIGISSSSRSTVGAWLFRDSGVSGSTDVECTDAFAGKPAPTGAGGVHSHRA